MRENGSYQALLSSYLSLRTRLVFSTSLTRLSSSSSYSLLLINILIFNSMNTLIHHWNSYLELWCYVLYQLSTLLSIHLLPLSRWIPVWPQKMSSVGEAGEKEQEDTVVWEVWKDSAWSSCLSRCRNCAIWGRKARKHLEKGRNRLFPKTSRRNIDLTATEFSPVRPSEL